MFSNDTVSKIKEIAQLSQIMGEHIKLYKSGRSITCCCPFHNDKNPSMAINDDKGFYHCFGCGASGDVFSFMQEYLQMSFQDALKALCERYNITPSFSKAPKVQNDVLLTLQEHYVVELAKNTSALNYLYNRGYTDASIASFNLGYAPSNALSLKWLELANKSPEACLQQGALKRKDNQLYASFIERITFPIYDASGNLVGFGARTLNANNPAKYVNSPACALFDKKQLLYGYFSAKSAIRKHKIMLVCEGYLDVIAFHQCGINYAVAALGVAFGKEHLRFINKDIFIRLCFDSDSAGQNAAFKAASLLAGLGYNGDVINLAPFKDAGEFLQNAAGDKLAHAAQASGENIISFAIDYIFKTDLNIFDVKEHIKCDPYLVKGALAKILDFVKSIDQFLAKSHLELFAKRAHIDISSFMASPIITAPSKSPEANTKVSRLECSILQFIINSRTDFSDILLADKFNAKEIINLLINKRFDDFKILKFRQDHLNDADLNIVQFLINLACLYSQSSNDARCAMYLLYQRVLAANLSHILSDVKKLQQAYLTLIDINLYDWSSGINLSDKINSLGAV